MPKFVQSDNDRVLYANAFFYETKCTRYIGA